MFTVIGWELQHCHQKWLKFIPDGYFTIEIRLQSHDYKIGRLNRMMQCLKVVQPRCISSSVTHFGRRARPATGKLGWWFFLLSELWEVSLSCKEMFFGVMAVRVIGHWLGYDGYLIKVFGSVSPRRWHTFAGYCHHLSGLRCLLPTGQGLTYWPCLIVVGPSALLSDFPRTSSWLITFRFCPGIALNCSALVLSWFLQFELDSFGIFGIYPCCLSTSDYYWALRWPITGDCIRVLTWPQGIFHLSPYNFVNWSFLFDLFILLLHIVSFVDFLVSVLCWTGQALALSVAIRGG